MESADDRSTSTTSTSASKVEEGLLSQTSIRRKVMMMRSSETDSSKVEDKSLQQMQSVHPVEISYSPAPLLLSNSSASEAVDVVSKTGGGAEIVEIGMELATTTGGEQSTCGVGADEVKVSTTVDSTGDVVVGVVPVVSEADIVEPQMPVRNAESSDDPASGINQKTELIIEKDEKSTKGMQIPSSCSNCKARINAAQSLECKNFHELLPNQYINPSTGGHTDVQIVDALSEIFKIQWTYQNYAEIYARNDLSLCTNCASVLTELYKLYNEFSSLTIKSEAFLSTVINFEKDLNSSSSTNKKEKGRRTRGRKKKVGVEALMNAQTFFDAQENVSGGNTSESGDESFAFPSGRKRTNLTRQRRAKKMKRYQVDEDGEDDDDDDDDNEEQDPNYDSDTGVEDEKVYKAAKKSSRRASRARNDISNCIITPDSLVSQKKLETEETIPEHQIKKEAIIWDEIEDEDSCDYTIVSGKLDIESSGFKQSVQEEGNGNYEYDENEPLHDVVQRFSGAPIKDILEDSEAEAGGGASQTLECKECDKVFKFPIQLRIHLNSQPHQEKVNKKPPRKGGRKPNSYYKKPPVTCKCGKTYDTNRKLKRHMKVCINFEGGGGDCDRCGKKFKTQGGLRIHYAAHIRDDNKHVCKDCGKKFRKQEALQLHERTDHGGFKPHVCSQCDKRFRLKDKLKLHVMVIHEKRKPFPCPKCEKSFRTKYHLKIHDVSQHIQGGDNSIGCSQCKRKFPDREALVKHLVVHDEDKPYICSVCNKGFQTSARLRLHEKSHQEVPSCLCPVCGRAYKHNRDLRLHEVVHQDESTYRFGCGDCQRRFYRIDLLRVHQSNEQHFSSEVIGPTVTKSTQEVLPNDGPKYHAALYNNNLSRVSNNDQLLIMDEEEEDENETDNESIPSEPTPPPPKKSRGRSTINRKQASSSSRQITTKRSSAPTTTSRSQPSSSGTSSRERDLTVMHPHTTVIYHNPAMVQLHLDQQNSPVGPSAVGIRNETTVSATANMSNASSVHHHSIQQQTRYANNNEVQSTTSSAAAYAIMNQQQRDGRQTIHSAGLMQGIQIQPISSVSHPHIQFSNNGNNAIYTMRDGSGNPTINISNVINPSDPMQYDNIISFINNLG